MPESLLQAALRYADAGWPVFPVEPGPEKRPKFGLEWKDAATCDPIVITSWWTENPDYNIGFSPGLINLLVVDADAYKSGYVALVGLTPTLTAYSARGGIHYYYYREGSGPNSVELLAPCNDTRGNGGYVLLPPSRITYDGEVKEYRWEDPSADIADLPQQIYDTLMARATAPILAPEGVEWDTDTAIARAITLIEKTVENEGCPNIGASSDIRTWQLACELKDFGISPETSVDLLLEHWAPHFDGPWVKAKVESAFRNGQNEPGSKSLSSAQLAENYRETHKDDPPRRRRFQARLPEEDANLPPLTYWDAQCTFPNLPGGCSLVVTGRKTAHKTGLILKKCLDAIEQHGAKVLYIALEGAHGIQTIRLPLYMRERGLRWPLINQHWRTMADGFDLFTDIDAIVEEYRDFAPNIVVIDTLTRAVPGSDINTPQVGAALHIAADKFAAAFGALVPILHHPGNQGARSLGSVLIEALAYAVWHVTREGDIIDCWIEKMKDGKAEFSVQYAISWTAPGNVPCVRDVRAGDKTERPLSAAQLADRFLLSQIQTGPVPTTELKAAATANGHAWSAILRAKTSREAIKASKIGSKWYWGFDKSLDINTEI